MSVAEYPQYAPSALPRYPVMPLPALSVAQTIAKKGYNPQEADLLRKLDTNQMKEQYLRQNLETTVNHVFEDSAVSFTNFYSLNKKGEVVSYPDGTVLNIDKDERGGLNTFGITSAVAGAIDNPGQVMLLYSPPGPVVFDDNPDNKFKDVKPYTDGQLYMMYSDGQKVNNIAVSISQSGEEWVRALMPYVYDHANRQPTDIKKVSYFITNPALTGLTMDALLEAGNGRDITIYENKDGVRYSLSGTLALIRQSLAGTLPKSHIVEEILKSVDFNAITRGDIDWIYNALAQGYMADKGLTSMTLGGSCGGDVVKLDIFSPGMENLSTDFRRITQGKAIPGIPVPKDDKEKITFEFKPGHHCLKCDADGSTIKLGDCDICTTCQAKFDSGEYK